MARLRLYVIGLGEPVRRLCYQTDPEAATRAGAVLSDSAGCVFRGHRLSVHVLEKERGGVGEERGAVSGRALISCISPDIRPGFY